MLKHNRRGHGQAGSKTLCVLKLLHGIDARRAANQTPQVAFDRQKG
jgi:hypothetical protein